MYNQCFVILDILTGTHYFGNNDRPVEDYLFREETFTSMKFNSGLAPVSTNMSAGDKRPLSAFSMKITDSEPANLLTMKPGYLSPPPAYYNPARLVVTPKNNLITDSLGNQSPTSISGSRSPKTQRSHSPFEDRESPLPPVSERLYNGEYIRTPEDRSLTPVLPAPSPIP